MAERLAQSVAQDRAVVMLDADEDCSHLVCTLCGPVTALTFVCGAVALLRGAARLFSACECGSDHGAEIIGLETAVAQIQRIQPGTRVS